MTDLLDQEFDGHELLPLNPTPMERASADIASDIFLDIPVPIETLWNPWECPAEYLPWLAWALSVDTWDATWPETVKRRAIAASPTIHRYKGTRYAVELALATIGLKTKITEWWEVSPPTRRGTFSVLGLVNEQIYETGPLIDERMQELAHHVIKASKPKSRVYDFALGVEYSGKTGLAAASAPPITYAREKIVAQAPEVNVAGSQGMAAAMPPAISTFTDRAYATAPVINIAGSQGLAATTTHIQTLKLTMEVTT